MSLNKRIAFIGGGNMAEALIKGILSADVATSDLLTVTDVSPSRIATLKSRYRIAAAARNIDAVREAEIVLLCVKPQQIDGVMAEIAPAMDGRKLVVSIAAGVPLERIARGLGGKARVVRVMPNAPALVLAGATAIAGGPSATHADMELAQELFGAIGRVVVVEERHMDAVTGLSGSGPAYVFAFIESLADGGVKAGLSRTLALELAVQTVLGSARMVLETKEHPAKLRDLVTSPGGTTISGLHELEKGKFRAAVMSAVEAAAARSKELGGKLKALSKKAVAKAKPAKAKPAKGKGKKKKKK